MLIDTHCHLTYPGLIDALPAVLSRASDAGIRRFVTIGTHPADHQNTLSVVRAHPAVFGAAGIHPHHAAETEPGWESPLEHLLTTEPKFLALGECGLDYHYDFSPRKKQRDIFVKQLALAHRLRAPVILHVREAHDDALAVVRDFPSLTYVVHCFTGTVDECDRWLAVGNGGAYVGITGIVTYKNAANVRDVAKRVPAARLLLETDAPYLSPEPVRKVKVNEPSHVQHIARFVANLRGTTVDALAQQTTDNAARFYGPKLTAALPGE